MEHPSPELMAAYVENRLSGDRQTRVETHLATCGECVEEVGDLRAVLRPARPGWRRFALPLAAAATIAALLAVPALESLGSDEHRAPAAAAIASRGVISPVGTVRSATAFNWRKVSDADQYRITVFDTAGTAVWSATTADTAVNVPDSIALTRRTVYLWQVEARVGFDRWLTSELARFEIER